MGLSPAGECAPPPPARPGPLGSGERGTLAGERGGGRVPIPSRVLFIHMYFVGEDLSVYDGVIVGVKLCIYYFFLRLALFETILSLFH